MTSTKNDDAGLTLGEVLRRGRAHAGLSVRALSEQAGISVGQLSKLENDQVKKVNPAHLAALAGPLGVTMYRLYAAAGYQTPQSLATLAPDLVHALRQLPDHALVKVDRYVAQLVEEHGTSGSGLAVDHSATI